MSSRLARHAWVLVLVLGVALFVLDERTMVATRNPDVVPSAILLGASVVVLAVVSLGALTYTAHRIARDAARPGDPAHPEPVARTV